MISHFFIDRPIFATVLSVVLVLAGAVAVQSLPVAQYPDITPPTVQVSAFFPGANARTVSDTVAQPIEQQVSGVENALYMTSQCTNDGRYNLLVTFKLGVDANMAQVLTQNRVQLALPSIPDLVQREGVSVLKMSPSVMMIVNLVSEKDSATGKPVYDDIYLSNYATIQIRDELLRLPGIANVTFMGQRDYSMRVWLNPEKMSTLKLSTQDIVNSLSEQNIQVAAGSIGQQPVPKGQQFQLIINTLGRLTSLDQFGDVIVKVGNTGQSATDEVKTQPQSTASPSIVRLRDVARIELGAQQYDQTCTLDGQPSVALSIYQLPGSNALETAEGVYQKMRDLKARFPAGLDYKIVYDTTPFIQESIREVFKTLIDAIILVAIVVLVFLQSWRATIIPLVAVPVAVVGTFAAMAAFGFSRNNLSLFGLVLAIGIVVDDAIVVVENVERWLEEGYSPRDAARKAMDEVTGPVIAVALVLCAVFVPCAFISGITGQFFRQFAVTIAVSTVISAFNSLTLSPALAAILLKPKRHGRLDWVTFGIFTLLGAALPMYLRYSYKVGEEIPLALYGPVGAAAGAVVGATTFLVFNRIFALLTSVYAGAVSLILRLSIIVLIGYGGLLYLTYDQFTSTPTGFIPPQDKGYLLVNVQLPDSASVQRTQSVLARLDRMVRGDPADPVRYPGIPGVQHTVAIAGQSLLLGANAPNLGSMNVMLRPFTEREGGGMSGEEIAQEIRRLCAREIREAVVAVFGPPPIDGLGTAGGFKMMIEDRSLLGARTLQGVCDRVVATGNRTEGLRGLFTSMRNDTPWLYMDIDRDKCLAMGVSLENVFNALQVYLGSYYVNQFNEFGRVWQVNLQADNRFRDRIEDIRQIKVPNTKGDMVPLASMADIRDISGPLLLLRHNMYSAGAIYGDAAPGTSSGDAITRMQAVVEEARPRMAYEWTELTFLQLQAGGTAMVVFALAVVFVFLVLAAQYESWTLPLAVILVVPMCLLCAVVGVNIAAMDINIFTQIGFVVLVGLAGKNAILIVEFAKQQVESGVEPFKATLEASRLRLRPILMTSFAFILGVVPLVIAEGAGAEMRRALGIAVFAGMLGVTAFGIFLTPVFFLVIQRVAGRRKGRDSEATLKPAPEAGGVTHPGGDSNAITDRPGEA